MELKNNMNILKIRKSSKLEQSFEAFVFNMTEFNKKNKNLTRAETFFVAKLGYDWREKIKEEHGSNLPDLMVFNLENILASRSQSDINNTVEAFKLWATKGKSHNLVGFFRLDNEYQRHDYLKKHGIVNNSLVFAEMMGINVASKITQATIAHYAVAGLAMAGATVSAHVLLPIALLTVGVGFMAIKHKMSLPEHLADLKRYHEEGEMPLSAFTDKPKVGESLQSMREKGALSFLEVKTVMKKIGFRNLGLMKSQSLKTLRDFTDDFITVEKTLADSGETLTGKEIANKVIASWKASSEKNELLKEGRKHWFKHSLKEFLLLASPISLEVFPALEHAIGGLVDETTARILLKSPEALAIAKESKSDTSGFEHVSHSKNPETIKEKLKRFIKKPKDFKYNDHKQTQTKSFKLSSKEDLINNIDSKMKENSLSDAMKNTKLETNINQQKNSDLFTVGVRKQKI